MTDAGHLPILVVLCKVWYVLCRGWGDKGEDDEAMRCRQRKEGEWGF